MAKLDRSPLHQLHRVMQEVDNLFRTHLGSVTPRQLAVLVAIDANERASQAALAATTGIDRSTFSELIRRLQRAGLVRRKRQRTDRRAYALALTEQGRKVARSAEPLARLVDERVLSALPAARRERFLGALATIVELLGQADSRQSGKVKH
jgi:MarR family transcriptional regulator, temperature-dependent positive regulator of motility